MSRIWENGKFDETEKSFTPYMACSLIFFSDEKWLNLNFRCVNIGALIATGQVYMKEAAFLRRRQYSLSLSPATASCPHRPPARGSPR